MKINFGTINIEKKSKELINNILETENLSSGQYVLEFENRISSLLNAREAVAVSSGTSALILSLLALYDFGAKRGDEIIIPALSFVSSGSAALFAGFKPVFVDVKKNNLNIDVSKIEENITNRTRAILPVHLMGIPVNMDVIVRISRDYNLFIIEDAAEAWGGFYKGKALGTIGDFGAFSLYIAHIITSVDGGIVTTTDEYKANIIRSLRNHGRRCDCKVCTFSLGKKKCKRRFSSGDDTRFEFDRIGLSSKMNELEAAVGLGVINCYYEIVTKRLHRLTSLINGFKQFSDFFEQIEIPINEHNTTVGPHAFPIVFKEDAPFLRSDLIEFLYEKEIDFRTLFSSIPTQCKGFEFLGYKYGDFPNAEFIGKNAIHLGVHQDLTESDIEYIIKSFEEFIKKY